VVSFLPSMTENLFALGFGQSVVGITDYCLHPAEQIKNLPRIGGPYTPDIPAIVDLEPELVIGSLSEAPEEIYQEMVAAGLRLWLTHSKSVNQALDDLRALLAVYHTDKPALRINTLQMAVDYARVAAENEPKVRYFCPIWMAEHEGQTWWMTFNQDTYLNDILSIVGGENVFAERARRYPLEADLGYPLEADLGLAEVEKAGKRDTRYPRVTVEEVIATDPEMILLPDDPFVYKEEHKQKILVLLSPVKAVKQQRILFVEGSLIAWPGVRMGKALQELPNLFIR
jgi:ABC-type Fe3+-hydroxamate transport system substrate-binding protein